jgi:tetratricopeptide (TPR) repeat protein
VTCLVIGTVLGTFGSQLLVGKGKGKAPIWDGKSKEEAAAALLTEAERLAGDGSWERIAVGRVYYLSGNKERGQELFDQVLAHKPEASDLFRLGRIHAEAGELDKAVEMFDRALEKAPKDDSGMVLAGAWHNIKGDRARAEELFQRAFDRSNDSFWHHVGAGGSYLGVPPR